MVSRRTHFTIALLWALIPVTLFGSVPRMGCICANGQHKFFCERFRTTASDARCVCCYGRETGKSGTKKNSAGAMTCCGTQRPAKRAGLPEFDSGRPCRPVLDRPQFVGTAKAIIDLEPSDHTPLLLATVSFAQEVVCVAVDGRGDLPPPPDLVTTLRVLLI